MIFFKETRICAYLLMDPFKFFYSYALKKMRYTVWGLRRGSGTRYRTATDYGPGICIRVRIPYLMVRGRILVLLWCIKIKLLGDWIRVQYSDPDLPGLVRVIRASHLQDTRCPRWRGQSRKTTTGPKSGLTLSLTGVGLFGPSLPFMQISLKVLKLMYRRKLGIPQAGSYACIEITTVPILYLISL